MKYYQFEHSFLSRQALIEFEIKRNTITIKKESKNPWKRTRYHLMEINGEKEFKGNLPLNLRLTPNDYAIYFAREVWFRQHWELIDVWGQHFQIKNLPTTIKPKIMRYPTITTPIKTTTETREIEEINFQNIDENKQVNTNYDYYKINHNDIQSILIPKLNRTLITFICIAVISSFFIFLLIVFKMYKNTLCKRMSATEMVALSSL